MLTRDRLVTERDLAYLDFVRRALPHIPTESLLLREGLVSEETLATAISRAFQIPIVDVADHMVPREALLKVPFPLAVEQCVFPLSIQSDGKRYYLLVAMADPTDVATIDKLQFATSMSVRVYLGVRKQLRHAIRRAYCPDLAVEVRKIHLGAAATPHETTRLGNQPAPPAGRGSTFTDHPLEPTDVTWFGAVPHQRVKDLVSGTAEQEAMCLLEVIAGEGAGQRVPFRSGQTLLVGRDPSADIQLRDPQLSRQHLRILAKPDGVWLEDLGSVNGTTLNGHRLHGTVKANDGDELTLCSTRLRLHVY